MAHLHQLRIIKTQDDCSEFIQWLSENAEVSRVQGWFVVRNESGRVHQFAHTEEGYGGCYFWADVKNVWAERKSFNDWIRTFKDKFFDWTIYGQFASEMKEKLS